MTALKYNLSWRDAQKFMHTRFYIYTVHHTTEMKKANEPEFMYLIEW